jgi:hypothetical protein
MTLIGIALCGLLFVALFGRAAAQDALSGILRLVAGIGGIVSVIVLAAVAYQATQLSDPPPARGLQGSIMPEYTFRPLSTYVSPHPKPLSEITTHDVECVLARSPAEAAAEGCTDSSVATRVSAHR